MCEPIAVGVAVHVLSRIADRILDSFWKETGSEKYPYIDLEGSMGYSVTNRNVLQVGNRLSELPELSGLSGLSELSELSELPEEPYEAYSTISGRFYVPEIVRDLLGGDEIVLLLVYEEDTQEVSLFETSLDLGYTITLPPGTYSFFTFLLDPEAEDMFEALIYAIGFPGTDALNFQDLESFSLENPEEIWNFVDLTPIWLAENGSFHLDIVFVDTDMIPDFPMSMLELF